MTAGSLLENKVSREVFRTQEINEKFAVWTVAVYTNLLRQSCPVLN
jgi:hypothetical protein